MTAGTIARWRRAQATRAVCAEYLELLERMARLVAAEDRAFAAYMAGTGSAGSARKAKSRVNRLSPVLASAEIRVYRAAELAGVEPGDAERFAREIVEATR